MISLKEIESYGYTYAFNNGVWFNTDSLYFYDSIQYDRYKSNKSPWLLTDTGVRFGFHKNFSVTISERLGKQQERDLVVQILDLKQPISLEQQSKIHYLHFTKEQQLEYLMTYFS